MDSGLIGSAAGSQLAQTTGAGVGRAQHDSSNQTRKVQVDKKAENAAGIGQTEEDQQSSERDADGRCIWENRPDEKNDQNPQQPPPSKDPTGQSGNRLDLSG